MQTTLERRVHDGTSSLGNRYRASRAVTSSAKQCSQCNDEDAGMNAGEEREARDECREGGGGSRAKNNAASLRMPFDSICNDFRTRWPFYRNDWAVAAKFCGQLVGPTTYIFSISIMKALAFGGQLNEETQGHFQAVHVIASTCVANLLQARPLIRSLSRPR